MVFISVIGNPLKVDILLSRATNVDVLALVLLVNDSEYSKSTGTKPILSRCCIYLVSPGARCCCCGSCGFLLLLLLLLLRAPTPPRPLLLGEGSAKKENRL